MKIILLLLLPLTSMSQFYSKVEGQVAENIGAVGLSIGAVTKSGPYFGAGALMFLAEGPYVPIFFEFGFVNNAKVLFPSAQVRIGHSIANDQPFDSEYGQAGLYLDARIGFTYRPNMKMVRIVPYVGYTSISADKRYENTTGNIGYVNFGLSLMVVKRK